jgi:hypothetical protein
MMVSDSDYPILDQLSIPSIVDALRQFTEDSIALEADMHDLVMRYPNQWAGMYKGEVTIAPTLVELLQLLEGQPNVAVRFLDPYPRTLILSAVGIETVA